MKINSKKALVLTSLLALSACHGASASTSSAPAPTDVTVAKLEPQTVELKLSYTGRVAALREVEVRARVAGVLLDRAYVEGSKVQAGALLFRIDPAGYDSARAKADAQLQLETAIMDQAENDARRNAQLASTGAIAAKQREDSDSALSRAKASVASAQASLRGSRLELGYTTVLAPIAGMTSVEALPKGSLVSVGTLLTRVRQIDPVNVEFSFETDELAELRRRVGVTDLGAARLPTTVRFSDGTTSQAPGVLDFVESGIDRTTGTVHGRAVFPNADASLVPGDFVRINVGGAKIPNAIVVPEKAVLQTVQGRFAYVVDAENKVEMRPVTLGREVTGGWIVDKGLAAGDRVVVEGVMKIGPGAPVVPHDSPARAASAADVGAAR